MKKILLLMVVIAVGAGVAAILWRRQAAIMTTLTALQHQCEELQSQLEARDQMITELRASIERLQQHPMASPSTGAAGEAELARRLSELTMVQSKTLALVDKLMSRADPTAAPESSQQKEAAITALQLSVAEHQAKLEAIKQRAAELLVTLNIPADISTMEASKALDTASLKAYWPFFEAKRERESMQYVMDRLLTRLMQEQVEAKIQAQKSGGQ